MPYQYGMQNSPSGGNGLGGLPKKQTTPKQVNFTRIVTAGSGTIVPPANAKYMRVAVVGPGGSAATSWAGGGGGCAASKIVPASPISYTVGSAVLYNASTNPTGAGIPSVATFPGYRLVGGSGLGGSSMTGGIGSGGDYNFTGGSGTNNLGAGGAGGAAGPNGNGGNSGLSGQFAGTGWGCGGGSSSVNSGATGEHYGGGGSGATGFLIGSGAWTGLYVNSTFGDNPDNSVLYAGGVMGGGGGYQGSLRLGGVGGIVVEWFYD